MTTSAANIQSCRKRVEDSLALVGSGGSLSCKSIKDITHDLLETDQAVVGMILEWKNDSFQSGELQDLVKEYFRGNLLTMDVVSELENCLMIVDNSHSLLLLAIQIFVENKNYAEIVYAEIVERLEKFKANGDPFKVRFWGLYVKVCEQQKSLLHKVEQMHDEVVRRREDAQRRQQQAANPFGGFPWTVIEVLVPVIPLGMFLFGGITPAILTDTFSSVEQDYKHLISEEELTKTIMGSTLCVITDLETIGVLVKNSTEMIKSLSGKAGEVIKDKDVMELVMDMDNMKNEVEMFREEIVHMTIYTGQCKNDILSGREKILALK